MSHRISHCTLRYWFIPLKKMRVPRNGNSCFTMMSLHINNHFAKRRGIATNVLFAVRTLYVRNKVKWLLGGINGGETKAVTLSSATVRSKKRSPTRIYQSYTAYSAMADQVAFQENGLTYKDSSSRRILIVSGRDAATARSTSIEMFLAFDPPTKVATT